ncbi:MAG: 3-oxoacyl-ACP synthase, partial [Thermodesulfobacteriota bacterium]|nr:3-oxoacyl-ACP synthase [Thermodesulfobacteriota bacterium]
LDLVILGINGDADYDSVYSYLTANLFDSQVITYFKHLCGEYDTSSAFAFWTAVNILKSQEIPPIMRLNTCNKKVINNILIYNQNYNKNHSFMLLSK